MHIYLVFVFVTICRTCQIFVRGVLCRRSVHVITFSFSIQVCVVMCATPTFSSYFVFRNFSISAVKSNDSVCSFLFLYLALSFSIFFFSLLSNFQRESSLHVSYGCYLCSACVFCPFFFLHLGCFSFFFCQNTCPIQHSFLFFLIYFHAAFILTSAGGVPCSSLRPFSVLYRLLMCRRVCAPVMVSVKRCFYPRFFFFFVSF